MKEIIINTTEDKNIIVLTENGSLLEKYEEYDNLQRLEGNVYLGVITDILPGMQAAFVDIGDCKNAFLHIKDILPKVSNKTGNKNEDLNKYNIKTINDFYRKSTMDTNFPLYIDMSIVWPTIETLSQIIHENGGKIFLAHPYKYIRDNNIDWLLSNCLPHIDGIEISNEPKNSEEVSYLYSLAKNNNKLISVGSDYHGSKLHNDYNVKFISEKMEEDIINWIKNINGKIQINGNNN